MNTDNEMTVTFDALSQNESFARVTVASFATRLNPTVTELTDIKTAVSEAVTNAIIHGYESKNGKVCINCKIFGRTITIEVADDGKGIDDIEKAREPLYTSKPEMERSGMGFTVMETFMDSVIILSEPGTGTKIIMSKELK